MHMRVHGKNIVTAGEHERNVDGFGANALLLLKEIADLLLIHGT